MTFTLAGCVRLFLLAVLLQTTSAFWRMKTNGTLGIARIDPIVAPGKVNSHVHIVHGGRNFGMNATSDILKNSNCTSADVTQDNSGYWTPTLMFQFTNGTVVTAEKMSFVAYYFLNWPGQNMTAFPDGFRMLSGNPMRRTFDYPIPDPPRPWTGRDVTQDALAQKALGFNCLGGAEAEASLYRHFLPSKGYLETNCPAGLRIEVMFPSCWNGKDLDPPDHKSHVQFLDQVIAGECPDPENFPVRLPGLFYESTFNVSAYKDYEGQYMISTADPTGCSNHGDFMMGWTSVDLLQNAVNTCLNSSGNIEDCPVFDIGYDSPKDCAFDMPAILANDNPQGPRQGLPGNLQVVYNGTSPMPTATPPSAYSSLDAKDFKTPVTTAPLPDFSVGYSLGFSGASNPPTTTPAAAPPATAAAAASGTTSSSTPAPLRSSSPAPSTASAGKGQEGGGEVVAASRRHLAQHRRGVHL
ncbi:MAG: hypothetical protein M1821_005814 [Bathelium mastoideum]|nr:MAG: hypothetical protein M1821_005814 [Bathelium mastoideum]